MTGRLQRVFKLILSLCMLVLLCIPVHAADNPVFRLETDSLNLQKGVSSSIVVSLINAKNSKISSIDGIENFDVLSQNTSTSTSIVNNEITQQVDYYYTIMPKAAGQFTLKANISYNGGTYETNSLDITVTEGANNGSGTAADLFAEIVLSHEEAYIGEKIILTYYLYSRLSIDELGFTDYIAIDGAIAKEIPQSQIKAETVYIDGNNYTRYEMGQFTIDPIKTGTCTIPSFNLQVNVITNNNTNNPFGNMGGFFRSTEARYLQTEAKELSVKPLPTEGKPANFSGIVGDLQLDGNYSRNELSYGDSLALQVKASGNCNLDGLKNIAGGEISGFTVYETQKETVETVTDNQYHAEKSFEVILIPETIGELKVPSISVSYFNPATGKYEAATIKEAVVNVLGEMPVHNGNGGNNPVSFETVLINQVSYTDDVTANDYTILQIKKWLIYAVICGIAVLIAAAVGVTWLLSNRRKQNTTLKTIYKKAISTNDINEVYNLFNGMIKHCLGINLKSSSKASIASSLADADLAVQITDIMDYMESNDGKEKEHTLLKDKIKGVYIKKLRRL